MSFMRSSSEAIVQTKMRSYSEVVAQIDKLPSSITTSEPQSGTGAQRVTQRVTQRVFGPMVAAGAAAYRRDRDLPKLVRLDEAALADDSIAGTEQIVIRLAARQERKRGSGEGGIGPII